MIRIKEWFQGNRNFQKGKLLYDALGHDDDLKKLFQKGKNKHSQIVLERALTELLEHKSIAQVSARANIKTKPINTKKKANAGKPVPEEVKPLIAQKSDLYIVVRNIHSKMTYADTVKERAELAEQILDTWDAINSLHTRIDYFFAHGEFPEAPPNYDAINIKADVNDLIDIYERYKTLGSYISKAKKKGDKAKEEKAIIESNLICDIINKNYGFEKIKRR
jgi:hypothetical protein